LSQTTASLVHNWASMVISNHRLNRSGILPIDMADGEGMPAREEITKLLILASKGDKAADDLMQTIEKELRKIASIYTSADGRIAPYTLLLL
jgi:hypothetical protein